MTTHNPTGQSAQGRDFAPGQEGPRTFPRVATAEPEAGVPADLAAPARELVPSFPLYPLGIGLVLYDAAPGHPCCAWWLARDEVEHAAVGFPADGGVPEVVVRLARRHPEGGFETVAEQGLGPGVYAGAGETSFHVPPDHGYYRSELGLRNHAGGWLMLARSNGLHNAVGVGVDLPRRAPRVLDRAGDPLRQEPRWGAVGPHRATGRQLDLGAREIASEAVDSGRRDLAQAPLLLHDDAPGGVDIPHREREIPPGWAPSQHPGSSNDSVRLQDAVVPGLGLPLHDRESQTQGARPGLRDVTEVPAPQHPQPPVPDASGSVASPRMAASRMQRLPPLDVRVEPALDAEPRVGLFHEFPLAPVAGTPLPSAAGSDPVLSHPTASVPVYRHFDPLRQPPVQGLQWVALVQESILSALGGAPYADRRMRPDAPTPASDLQNESGVASGLPTIGRRIEPLRYESPPMRADGLELVAELRISGRAAPDTEIDLFGFPYRVGPGGRFQLNLSVDDPELIARALAAHPPPELARQRKH